MEKLSQHDAYSAEEETLVTTLEKTYTVVGICQRPGIEEASAPGYTLITTADAIGSADSLTVFVTLKSPLRIHSYANSIADNNDYVINDDLLLFMGLSGNNTVNALIYSFGLIVVAIIMIGSIFLVYNSFNISLNERTHQFGILMSVGATEKQLRNSVLFEGLCIGAIGIPVGIIISIPISQLVLSFVDKNFANILYDNVALTLKVSAPVIAAAALISLITILISAYIPAKKAARTPVMECIRQTNEVKVEAKALRTSKLTKSIFGLPGTLALKNFKRNKRRYRSIILSLTLSVVLFVTVSSVTAYSTQIVENSAEVIEDYDICFYSRDMEERDLFWLYDQMKTAEGVTESSYQAFSTYSCVLNTAGLSDHFLNEYGEAIGYDGAGSSVEVLLDIQFVEDKVYQQLLEGLGLSADEYSGQDGKMIMAGILPGKWYTQELPMEFTLSSASGEQTKTIRASFVKDYPDLLPSDPGEFPGYSLMVIAPYEVKPQFDALDATVRPTKLGMTFQSENPRQSTAGMQTIINGASITDDYNLYNVHAILVENRNITFIVKLFSGVFITLISLIAVANVFNTISTNIRLRRRELAMLRSVGMDDRAFNKMMRFECAFYGLRTMLYGLPLSAVFSWVFFKLMFISGTVDFVIPWDRMGISVLGVLLVVFITTMYALRTIKKENIIDALRDDMT